ncbi:inactive receptor-like serine/threonine-protein kinase At2g40270 [Phoenix dactylifera]|uniref:Inactive receptor-like serine/threonine-protein kinase At2g40270 n=1 Tax=Phoenix dactylifera TaxID=42345 RepID=A0A8B7C0H8_PHODC|nr:inactive receptor-like serine/threonine-protein kinase At2g40270 [Phoenix dactylifera]
MEGWRRLGMKSLQLVVLLVWLTLDLCASINDEGRALLRFRERVELDPYGALADWNEEIGDDPCSWFGVQCSGGRVVALNLEDLGLKGTLAPELGKLIHMKLLILRNNSFSGIIPREVAQLQNLEVLDLGHNNLSGPLPCDLNNILSLKILILGSNRFIGSTPGKFLELNILPKLQMDENLLSSNKGSITRNVQNATIRKLQQIGSKDKKKQHKNGENLPEVFSSPTPAHESRQHKDGQNRAKDFASPASAPSPVSSKLQLSPFMSRFFPPSYPPGISQSPMTSTPSISIPPSPFSQFPTLAPSPSPSPAIEPPSSIPEHQRNFDAAPPSSSVPNPSSSVSPSPSAAVDTVKHATSWTIYVSIAGAVSFLAICAVYVLCCRVNKVVTVKPWATGLSGQLQKAFVTGVPKLKRAELEIACEDFSNIIGSLPDCMLYKGTLSSGVEIAVISSAVTSAKDWSKPSESQFRKKIMTLSKVNHKNFVNLLGYCEERQPFTRMMVFEYAPNGTLFEHLHIKEAEHLDWAMRLRIAMGIAYCLEHMHQLNPPFILRNLDSTTIYLTDDYAAKISDLGFWNEAKGTEPVPENSSPLAPLSDLKSIMYSFGVILLEILSGRLPFSEDGSLEKWASCYLNGEKPLKDMIDPSLVSFHEESVSALHEVIRSCTNPEPNEQLTMAEVASRLRDITAMPPDGATPKVSPLWWAELEIIASEAN